MNRLFIVQNIESNKLKGSMIIVWCIWFQESLFTGLDYWTGLLDWTTGLDYWTGLLDWTTGLTQNGIKCLLQLFSV